MRNEFDSRNSILKKFDSPVNQSPSSPSWYKSFHMNGAIVILVFIGLVAWLNYLKNQQKKTYLQSKEAYIREILSRYPTAEGLEKLIRSEEWSKLMELYGKEPPVDNRWIIILLVGLGALAFCLAVASSIITVYVDEDMIYPAVFLGAIGVGLFICSAIVNHYLKKWKL